MRDDLIGYLLGALDDEEASRVNRAIHGVGHKDGGDGEERSSAATNDPAASDARVRLPLDRQLDILRRSLRPLEVDREPLAAPAGLADRTLAFVRAQPQTVVKPAVRPAEHRPSRPVITPEPSPTVITSPRVWLDRLIMGATAIAACVLLAPLLLEAIEESRTRRVERKLGVLGGALHGYANAHREFPTPPPHGPLSRAGLYAPTLVAEHRLRADDGTLLVPGSSLSRSGTFRIPSLEELERAVGTDQLEMLVQQMGGDFGYTLGHRLPDGSLQPIRDSRRGSHPIMADAPEDHGLHSVNHPSGLHHVLFEDGRVVRIFDPHFETDGDHLYRNHDGEIAAGVDEGDAAIGGSHHQP